MAETRPNLNPWARGDGPLPDNDGDLIAEIKALAAARRRDAENHPTSCRCDGCSLRRKHQQTRSPHAT